MPKFEVFQDGDRWIVNDNEKGARLRIKYPSEWSAKLVADALNRGVMTALPSNYENGNTVESAERFLHSNSWEWILREAVPWLA